MNLFGSIAPQNNTYDEESEKEEKETKKLKSAIDEDYKNDLWTPVATGAISKSS